VAINHFRALRKRAGGRPFVWMGNTLPHLHRDRGRTL
jgi:hypothetical protein